MSNNGHTRAVLYARVSSDDTGNDGSNLQSQLGMCREYAEQQGYSVIRELAEDERGASGADHNLPQLSKAMEMARDGAYEVFVVRELDRLARNMRKQFNIEDELKAEDVRIDYVLGRYVDDWRGEFLKNIEAAVAQAERDQIRERTRRGRRASVEKGNVTCTGRPPFGYREAMNDDMRTLEVYEPEARVVRKIFELYVNGEGETGPLSVTGIARYLTGHGVPTCNDMRGGPKKRGYAEWSYYSVRDYLRNKTYMGRWEYGKSDGKKAQSSDNIITIDVPAIVSEESWLAAEKNRQMSQSGRVERPLNRFEYLWKGIALCSRCGKPMTTCAKSPPIRKYPYYRCGANANYYKRLRACDTKSFRADYVDAITWGWVVEVLENRETLGMVFEEYIASAQHRSSPAEEHLSQARSMLQETEYQIERLVDGFVSGLITKAQMKTRKAKLVSRMEKQSEEVDALTAETQQAIYREDYVNSIEEYAEQVSGGLERAEGDIRVKREVLRKLGANLRLIDEGATKYAEIVFSAPFVG